MEWVAGHVKLGHVNFVGNKAGSRQTVANGNSKESDRDCAVDPSSA